jgi:peptidyl-prolyl cis-trans isomerase D
MALINKIREKSGLAVGVVAVGLILFIVGGDMFFGNNSILLSDQQNLGEIAGEDISLKEYQREIELAEQDYALQQNKTPTEAERASLREQA